MQEQNDDLPEFPATLNCAEVHSKRDLQEISLISSDSEENFDDWVP